jgi:aminoglycoside 6'-N-acetyltransferase I
MNVRPVQVEDRAEWLRMRMALWPDSEREKEASEIARFLADPGGSALPALQAVFVCARVGGGLCGMAEVSIRPYADGCETNNVGYLEAWYVDPDCRGQGIGRALVMAAEAWAVAQGCREMASDADLDNLISQEAHQRLGFMETGRVVQFVKPL